MVDIQVDRYFCNGLCRHYDIKEVIKAQSEGERYSICKKGYYINIVSESGTCVSQYHGSVLSYGSCVSDYINSFDSLLYVSSSSCLKVIGSLSDYPITIVSGINDTMYVEMNYSLHKLTLPSGRDLVPEFVADEIKYLLRGYSFDPCFLHANCEFVNGRFEISSPHASFIAVKSYGTANQSLGFSNITDTIASGITSTVRGSGSITLPKMSKYVSLYTTSPKIPISLSRKFYPLSSGTIEFKFRHDYLCMFQPTVYSTTALGIHLHTENSQSVSVTGTIPKGITSSGSWYFEAAIKNLEYFEGMAVHRPTYSFWTEIYDDEFPSYPWSLKYIRRSFYIGGEWNSYIPSDYGWQVIGMSYYREKCLGDLYVNNILSFPMYEPTNEKLETAEDAHRHLDPDKVVFRLKDHAADSWIGFIKIYKLREKILASANNLSNNLSSEWVVHKNPDNTSISIEEDPIDGGKVLKIVPGGWVEVSFTACTDIRANFKIMMDEKEWNPYSSVSGSVVGLYQDNRLMVGLATFSGGEIKKYDGELNVWSSCSVFKGVFEKNKWVTVEFYTFKDLVTSKGYYTFSVFDDEYTTFSGLYNAVKQYNIPMPVDVPFTGLNKIRFDLSSGYVGSAMYIKFVKVDGLNISYNQIFETQENYGGWAVNQPPPEFEITKGSKTYVLRYADGIPYGSITETSIVRIENAPDGVGKAIVLYEPFDAEWKTSIYKTFSPESFIYIKVKTWQYFSGPNSKIRYKVYSGDYVVLDLIETKSSITMYNNLNGSSSIDAGWDVPLLSEQWETTSFIIDSRVFPQYSVYRNGRLITRYSRLGVDTISNLNKFQIHPHRTHVPDGFWTNPPWNSTVRPLYVKRVDIFRAETLIDENFDNLNLGSIPTGWKCGYFTAYITANPMNGARCIRLRDTSSVDYCALRCYFDKSKRIVVRFKLLPTINGIFRLYPGDSSKGDDKRSFEFITTFGGGRYVYADGSYLAITRGMESLPCTKNAYGHTGFLPIHYHRWYFSRDPISIPIPYTHPIFKDFSGYRYYRVTPFDWVNVELHLAFNEIDGFVYTGLYVNGNKMPNNYYLGDSTVFSRGLALNTRSGRLSFSGLGAGRLKYIDSGWDFVEFSTDSYATSRGVSKSEVYLKDIEVITFEKDNLVYFDDFSNQIEDLPPSSWIVSANHPNTVLVKPTSSEDDYRITFGLWDYYYYRSGNNFVRLKDSPMFKYNNWYTARIDFDCANSYYKVLINGTQITPSCSFPASSFLDTIAFKAGNVPAFKNPVSFGIDEFRVYDSNGDIVTQDLFDDDIVGQPPLRWVSTVSESSEGKISVEILDRTRSSSSNLDDTIYTVVFAHPANSLRVYDTSTDTYSYALLYLPTCQSGSIYFDFFVRWDLEDTYYYIYLFSGLNILNVLRLNTSSRGIEGFQNNEWQDIDSSNIWKPFTWHQLKFDFDLYKCKVYLDSVYRDTVCNMNTGPLSSLKIQTSTTTSGNIYVDNIRVYDSLGNNLYTSSFSNLSINTTPTSWTGTGCSIQRNPQIELTSKLINNPIVVSGTYIGDSIRVIGDLTNTFGNNFYITLHTISGSRPGKYGSGLYLSVIDDWQQSVEENIPVLRYNSYYRITKNSILNGALYVAIPDGAYYTQDIVYKVKVDPINTITGSCLGDISWFWVDNRGGSSGGLKSTSTSSANYYVNDIVCKFNDGLYNDGDKFYIYAYSPWPHIRDDGPVSDLGSFRIGSFSDVMALRFRLKAGDLLLDSTSGYGFLGWVQVPVGATRFLYAVTSQWPVDRIDSKYFSEEYNYIYTPTWTVVNSGVPIKLFRDSTVVNNNRFASDMVFFTFYVDDDDRGVKDAQTRFWFEVI